MYVRPNLRGDANHFEYVRDFLGFGVIRELTISEATLVAPFTKKNPNIVYMAGSGLPPGSYPDLFGPNSAVFAIEIVRYEDKPKDDEPDLNVNRYVFGADASAHGFVGYDVTGKGKNTADGQVAKHWCDWQDIDDKFPTKRSH